MSKNSVASAAEAVDTALADLQLALAQWVAGELFHALAGQAPEVDGWTTQQAQRFIVPAEQQIRSRFPRLDAVLRAEGLTTKKALVEFPKWAHQNRDARLDDDELVALAGALRSERPDEAVLELLDTWMDYRSARWLMGFRGITNATNERSFISTVVPRFGLGNSLPALLTNESAPKCAALVGNLSALVLDFVARQKIGGANLNFFIVKQFPVLPPERYSDVDLAYIVPRVLVTCPLPPYQCFGRSPG